MIRSCKDADTQKLVNRRFCKKFAAIQKAARMRLERLDAGTSSKDPAIPGHRLEALKGDRKVQHSIRINDQYRICFVWKDNGAEHVEVVEYHLRGDNHRKSWRPSIPVSTWRTF